MGGGGAHARGAGCSFQDSYKIRNFGHCLVVLAAKLWFHIINFMQVTRKPEIGLVRSFVLGWQIRISPRCFDMAVAILNRGVRECVQLLPWFCCGGPLVEFCSI